MTHNTDLGMRFTGGIMKHNINLGLTTTGGAHNETHFLLT